MKIYQLENHKKVRDIAIFYSKFGYGKGDPKICQKYLLNSDVIIYSEKDNKVVGAVRSLSDGSRFAFPLDLFVDPKYRKGGIGSSLFKAIYEYYRNKNIRYIEFNTDPQDPNLEKFYKKLGCEKDKGSSVFKWK